MISYIKVWEFFDGEGYAFDIFTSEQDAIDESNSIDGGICTTTMENAIGMAVSQSFEYAKAHGEALHGLKIVLE